MRVLYFLYAYLLHLHFYLIQAKEAEGTSTEVPQEIREKLTELTIELLRPLTVSQLKEVRNYFDIYYYIQIDL